MTCLHLPMKDYLAQFPVEHRDAARPAGPPRLLPPLRSLDIVSTPTPAPEGAFGRPETARRKNVPAGLVAYALVIALGLFGGAWLQWIASSRVQTARQDEPVLSESVVVAPDTPEVTAVDTSSPLESGNWRNAPR